ncbi:MAG: thiamine phosphate synthase, partial [Prevotellaceae bacterium]|nr:thiamine phosphate synthase [Prevotellaceae bacterium]
VWRLHIRKPQASLEEVRQLIEGIDRRWYPQLSLHDHHALAMEYGCGIHLNARNPLPPEGWQGITSASCHSIEEAEERKKTCDYVFLSPIFDSISKQGYAAAFTKEELADASRRGVIDESVIALGGVTPKHLGELARIGFGGGAFLGHVWNYARGESFDSDLDTIFDGYIKPEH